MPQALWSSKLPTYNKLSIFGCEAYAFILRDKRSKLAPHTTKCIFLGYGTDAEFGYKQWDLEKQKLIRRRDVVFNKYAILSFNPSQPKRSGKQVSFDEDIVEGPTHRAELTNNRKGPSQSLCRIQIGRRSNSLIRFVQTSKSVDPNWPRHSLCHDHHGFIWT